MKRLRSRWVGAAFALFCASKMFAASEIVVAMRYLQAEGTSHSQLFLYREDGRLLRQLTHDDSGQMTNPVFAADGANIVFKREIAAGADYWSVDPLGKSLRKLDAAPEWYSALKGSAYFTNENPVPSPGAPAQAPENPDSSAWPAHFTTPDGTQEIVLKEIKDDQDDEIDGPGHGKHFELRNLKNGSTVELGTLPGFVGLFELLHTNGDGNTRFLIEPPLRLAFFALHLDSSDGDTTFALDLSRRCLVNLSPNWATPIPLPGEPAFLTLTEQRYVPIPGSKKTANCSYMERWDANLKNVRYARGPAGICYGASMYRPGQSPPTITVFGSDR